MSHTLKSLSVSLRSICFSAHKKNFIRFSDLVQGRHPETMTALMKLLELSENESDGGELSCSNLDSDEETED
ncbi:hypothetical protein TNCV_5013181 [Trichonephila clavipes]|nr:hypothetical protein TNCV_5013181 [Trichonephila clavipes]